MKLALPALAITLLAIVGGALAQAKPALPAEITKFVDRRAACNYFAGEPPFGKDRVAFLNKQMAKLRCRSIGAEEKALMRRYSSDPAIRDAIIQSRHATQD